MIDLPLGIGVLPRLDASRAHFELPHLNDVQLVYDKQKETTVTLKQAGSSELPHLSDGCLSGLRLDRRYGNRIYNIFSFAAAREIVGWLVETLKNRSNGGRAG